jgi:DeoR/GlpR family transcriptional regulator of sugar metabolism
MTIEWTNADHAILTLLGTGRCSVEDLVEASGYAEERIRDRLGVLSGAGHVRRVPGRTDLYELVEDPRRN